MPRPKTRLSVVLMLALVALPATNSIYEVNGEGRYAVSDVGATFGNSGNSLTRSKSAPKSYADSAFMGNPTSDPIDFVLHSRPFFLSAINIPKIYTQAVRKRIKELGALWN